MLSLSVWFISAKTTTKLRKYIIGNAKVNYAIVLQLVKASGPVCQQMARNR